MATLGHVKWPGRETESAGAGAEAYLVVGRDTQRRNVALTAPHFANAELGRPWAHHARAHRLVWPVPGQRRIQQKGARRVKAHMA